MFLIERIAPHQFGSLGQFFCSILAILDIHVKFGIWTGEKGLNMDAQDRQDEIQGPHSIGNDEEAFVADLNLFSPWRRAMLSLSPFTRC